MPDRRRHGADEDRGAGGARGEARPVAARPAGRLSAALRALCRPTVPGCSICATSFRGCGEAVGSRSRVSARGADLPQWRARCVCSESEPTRADRRASEARRRSCSSPTPSTAISSARISTPRSRCCSAAGYRVHVAEAGRRRARPLCCGRTFLSVGQVDEARRKPSACSRRSRPSSRAACRSSGSSRAASSASATNSRR